MKKIVMAVALAASLAAGGCAANRGVIEASGISTRSDVFREETQTPLPPGYADLTLTSSLKTHRTGVHHLEADTHGTGDYSLLLNVDGQAATLRPRVFNERSEPRGLSDTEAGDGVRYLFSTRIRLAAGRHRVVVASPVDGVAAVRDVVLSEGVNTLVLEPVYRAAPDKQRPGAAGQESFSAGLRAFRMIVNGNEP